MSGLSLLAGPHPRLGMESASDHLARLGPLPQGGAELIDMLDRSGLRGRGGAAFPVGTKWRSVAGRARGRAVILVNGAEGEPLSHKDRLLMESRPHLVLDGAALAAASVGAGEIVLYVALEHRAAIAALEHALAERTGDERRRTRLVSAPARYVSGEESAAVHFVNDGVALPTTTPPRPFERGVHGRPTLVQNIESLAHVAMIARRGDAWFRALGGSPRAPGTALITVSGAVAAPAVIEVAQGTSIAEVVGAAGGLSRPSRAVLLGGYFGGWVAAAEAWDLTVDDDSLSTRGHALGCGVLGILPAQRCGVVETARIVTYLADQSARQCGPCVFGLRAIAEGVNRIAAGTSATEDLDRLRRWTGQLPGRGACRHPDGAAGFARSALTVFEEEFWSHHAHRRCSLALAQAA